VDSSEHDKVEKVGCDNNHHASNCRAIGVDIDSRCGDDDDNASPSQICAK
jgi:hypothetical protein